MTLQRAISVALRATAAISIAGCNNLLACPNCWRSLASSPEGMRMADGFQHGIFFLLLMPFVLAGTIGYRIYKMQLRRRSLEKAEGTLGGH
jgi:hypothetical protein